MKRFRIDFAIREIDVEPGEEAQGIRFGDEVELNDIYDFFNKCRDAAKTLFLPHKKSTEELKAEINKLRTELLAREIREKETLQRISRDMKETIRDRDIKFLVPQAPSPAPPKPRPAPDDASGEAHIKALIANEKRREENVDRRPAAEIERDREKMRDWIRKEGYDP